MLSSASIYLPTYVLSALQGIKTQSKKANFIFVELYRLWENKDILMMSKARIFNSNVKSALLCGCETWEVTTQITIKSQTFVNRYFQRIMGIRWSKIISNTELWEAAGETPIMLQIRMRKWRWIGHTLKKGMNLLKNKHRIGIRREPEVEKERSKPGTIPFWRKQKMRQNVE